MQRTVSSGSITNVRPGTFSVRLILQSGYSQTSPPDEFYVLSVGPGSIRSGEVFGVV